MSHFVRASKYRHVYVDPPKIDETWSGVPLSTTQGEQSYIKGNTKYFAVAVQGGGGPFAVMDYTKPGRYDRTNPVISGHKGAVLDFDFHPFIESLVSSCSEDCTVKLWGIPEGGLTDTITESVATMSGHKKKVTLLRFHPTASNVLASAGADMCVKLWDVGTAQELSNYEGKDLIQDIVWDHRGEMYATSCKDKSVRFVDPRVGEPVSGIEVAHEGARSVKLVFLGSKEKLVSVGFTKQSQRHFKVWDPRNLSEELKAVSVDQAAGVILPFYDEDSSLLFLAGKGDGNIRYYECVDENPWCFSISEYRCTTPAKGMAMVPKRGLDVMKCETARLLKVTANGIEPLSFVVPRKSDSFQDDLFPPSYAGIPAHSAEEWFAGSAKAPVMMSLDPALRKETNRERVASMKRQEAALAAQGVKGAAPSPAKTAAPSSPTSAAAPSDMDAAMARIKELEMLLKKSGINLPAK